MTEMASFSPGPGVFKSGRRMLQLHAAAPAPAADETNFPNESRESGIEKKRFFAGLGTFAPFATSPLLFSLLLLLLLHTYVHHNSKTPAPQPLNHNHISLPLLSSSRSILFCSILFCPTVGVLHNRFTFLGGERNFLIIKFRSPSSLYMVESRCF